MYAAMSFSISYLSNACCCCSVVVVVGILQKTENVKESKTKRRRSLKKSKFLTTQTKAKCDFPRSRGGREKTKKKVSRTILAQSTASCMTSCFACFR